MTNPLIIVESPTKAKTITKFLGKGAQVSSSYGHIRDLPKSKLGVDVDNDFEPTYEITPTAKKRITALKEKLKKADKVILATDEDREGEAIAWHLVSALDLDKAKVPYERIVFHEITKPAIEAALEEPRTINEAMVDAQQARRVLDRLVGYKLSPLLWKKITFGLSAGRVQSVAVRLIVEREEEIRAFKQEEYWTIDGSFQAPGDENIFEAKLASIDGKSLDKFAIKNDKEAEATVKDIGTKPFIVSGVEQKETSKKSLAPFTTSTLQQEASKKLGYSAKQTMRIAQQLYEGVSLGARGQTGLITYMRTDSRNLAGTAIAAMRDYIKKELGQEYLPKSPKFYSKKQKGAQEAHEAIRPTDIFLTPEAVKPHMDERQFKLYRLIWQRTLACQMTDTRVKSTGVNLTSGRYTFRANGSVVVFDGWLKIYQTALKENLLPDLTEKDEVVATEITPNQHFTQPPARYTEASLIKTLEENGIGRPSTYAPTLSTIEARKYVYRREDKRFEPTDMGEVVNKLLVKHFPEIVDVQFTARMEEDLDKIAEGELEWKPMIKDFYGPFIELIQKKDKEIDKKEYTEEETDIVCEKCGSPMVKKIGRFGKFLACSNYPTCKNTKQLDMDDKIEEEIESSVTCPKCGKPMVIKSGRFGKFLACSDYPECKTTQTLQVSTGATCPKCKEGQIVEKKTKRGKPFYACSRYPDCENAYWQPPYVIDGEAQYCPECKSLLLVAGKTKIKCSSCDYTV